MSRREVRNLGTGRSSIKSTRPRNRWQSRHAQTGDIVVEIEQEEEPRYEQEEEPGDFIIQDEHTLFGLVHKQPLPIMYVGVTQFNAQHHLMMPEETEEGFHLIVEEQKEGHVADECPHPSKLYPHVINFDMNRCIITINTNYHYEGKLKFVTLVSADQILHPGEDTVEDKRVLIESMAKFVMSTIHNTIFGVLNFTLSGKNHNFFTHSLSVMLFMAQRLLSTGALGGLSPGNILARFERFRILITSSYGRREIGESGGVRYYTIALGPYPTERLPLSDAVLTAKMVREKLHSLFKQIAVDIISRIDDDSLLFISGSNEDDMFTQQEPETLWDRDNEDIDDFDELMGEANTHRSEREQLELKKSVFQIAQRRMEDVSFKFFPRYINAMPTLEALPVHFQSRLVATDMPEHDFSMPAEGDAERALLDPDWYLNKKSKRRRYSKLTPATTQIGDDTLDLINEGVIERDESILQAPDLIHDSILSNEYFTDRVNHGAEQNQAREMYELNQRFFSQPLKKGDLLPSKAIINRDYGRKVIDGEFFRVAKKTSIYGDADEENEEWSDRTDYFFGCLVSPRDLLPYQLTRDPNLWSPPANNDNNCFFRCLHRALNITPMKDLELENLRSLNQLSLTAHTTLEDASLFANLYNAVFYFWHMISVAGEQTIEQAVYTTVSDRFEQFHTAVGQFTTVAEAAEQRRCFHFIIHRNHCYFLVNGSKFIVNKVKCRICRHWYRIAGFAKHSKGCNYCNECKSAYQISALNKHVCGSGVERQERWQERKHIKTVMDSARFQKQDIVASEWVSMQSPRCLSYKNPTNLLNVWAADIEAFADVHDDDVFTSYQIGLVNLANYDRSYRWFRGRDCMKEFIEALMECQGILVFFNGGKFDAYLLLRTMIQRHYDIDSKSIVKNGSTVMTFQVHRDLKVIDLYLSIQMSLARACKAWNVPAQYCKEDFDHAKVYDWATASQHEEEVRDYLWHDVMALAELYRIYSSTMWKIFRIDIYHSISPSQYAMQCWLKSLKEATIMQIYIPHTGKEENDFRAAYYGGRVSAQRREYQSCQLEEHLLFNAEKEYKLAYEWINNFLVNPDVNSLYPFVQADNNYAYGKWRYVQGEAIRKKAINNLENEIYLRKTQFKVDVRCPTDLLTPFLVHRDEKTKRIVHDLNNKVGCWYWGSELIEAVKLGYRVTCIYEAIEFELYGDLFSIYVNHCWEGRKKNPKGGTLIQKVMNMAFKLAMNRLTGKFGQKSHKINTVIMTSKKDDVNLMNDYMLKHVTDFTPIFEGGEQVAMILDVEAENPDPSYPIYLSAQILAYSRVYMSEIMRAGDCYRKEENAIYYTDTDSLVVQGHVLEMWRELGLVGCELGQMSCDLFEWTTPQEQLECLFGKIVRGMCFNKKK